MSAHPADTTSPIAPGAAWSAQLLRDGAQASPQVMGELGEYVRRIIRRGVGNRRGFSEQLVEDVSQDAVIKVLQNLQTFRGDSQLTTWIASIALRLAFSEMRRAHWKDVSLERAANSNDEPGRAFEPVADAESVERKTLREELFAQLRQAMQTRLTEKQRLALEAELAGMPTNEVADRLQTNANALYKLVHDARKKLKNALTEAGITESDVRSVLGSESKAL